MFNFIIMIALTPLAVILASKKKNIDGYKTIALSIAIASVFITLTFAIFATLGTPIGESISKNINEMAVIASESEQIISMLGLEGMSKTEKIGELVKIYNTGANAIPAFLVILSTLVAYFEYRVLSQIKTLQTKDGMKPLEPIRNLTFPKNTVWGAIFIYMSAFVITLLKIPGADVLEINIRLLFQFLFEIQGVAVLFYFAYKKKWSTTVGLVLTLVFLFTSIGQVLLSFLGFFELGVGIRSMLDRKIKK